MGASCTGSVFVLSDHNGKEGSGSEPGKGIAAGRSQTPPRNRTELGTDEHGEGGALLNGVGH